MTDDLPVLIEQLRHTHIMFPRDRELRETLDLSLEQVWVKKHPDKPSGVRNRDEQDAIIVAGATGAGKTHSIRKALDDAASRLVDPNGNPCGRILSVKLPAPFSAKELARRILRQMDVHISDDLNEIELWEVAMENFQGAQVVLLHLDEFQRYSTIKTVGRSEKAKAVERLSATLNEILMHDDWPVALIISGTEEILPFWRVDKVDQVHRRTKFVIFEQMTPAYYRALDKALAKYAEIAGIGVSIAVTDIAGRIAIAGENTVGIALELTQESIVAAVREDAAEVTIEHFARVYARRTGFGKDDNPFLAPHWSKLGVREKLRLDDLEQPRK